MIRLSWLRRFLKDSKGISTAIGTVLLVVAMFVIASNVFLFTISQNTLYSQAVMESQQTDADRFNEKIIASDGNYTIAGNQVTVEAKLTNAGPVAAQIINLWVFDTTNPKYNSTVTSVNIGSGVSETVSVVVTIVGADPSHNFVSWFVTARGNTVPITAYEPEIEPGTGGELLGGPFLLTFSNDAFQYTSNNNPTSPLPAFEIDNDRTNILFWIKFNNRADRGIQISKLSFFLVEVRELTAEGVPGTMEYERYFHVVGPTSTSSAIVAYNPDYMQTIPSKGGITLKFGARTVGGTSFLSGEPLHGSSTDDNWSNLLWTFLVVFWRYEPTPEEPVPPTFGQTITYVAILSTP